MTSLLDGIHKLLLHGQLAPEAFASLAGSPWDGAVLVTEDRPLLTGARCTAPALSSLGYRPTLISDNMVAYCMWKGMVQAVLIAYSSAEEQGLVCPSGSLGMALCAAYHQLPTFALPAGDLPAPATADDLFHFMGQRVAARGVDALVPATDLVPWQWITAHWNRLDQAPTMHGETFGGDHER